MSELLGHDRVVNHLANARRSGRLAHGLLFLGDAGTGRETCARLLARGLLCDDADALPFGCGLCGPCRRADGGTHPDLHVVMTESEAVARGLREPEGKRQPSREIRVSQIRELARVMRLKPYEGRARMAVVVDAHLLNPNAANALLKTLEEPGDDSYLILLAPHERAVLPTISSRCQRVSFAPLAQEVVARILGKLGVEDADARAKRADGSVQSALATDPDSELEARVPDLVAALLDGDVEARLEAAEALGRDRRSVDEALVAVERALSAQLRRAGRSSAPEAVRARRRLIAALDALSATRDWLLANSNVQLSVEELFFSPVLGTHVERPRLRR